MSRENDELDSRYGWVIVGVSFCSMIFTWGTMFSFGVFLDPLENEFGYSTVRLSTAYSVSLLAFYGLAGIVGVVASKIPIRPMIGVLAGMLAIVGVVFYFVSSYLGLVLVFSLMGTSLGAMYVLLVAIVPQWFDTHQGLAMGIIFSGNGLGVQLLPPTWEWTIGTIGLRDAFFWITALTVAVFLVTGAIVRRPSVADRGAETDRTALLTWIGSLAHDGKFWLAFFGSGFLFAWYYLLTVHAVNMFEGIGYSRGLAATLFGLIGGVSVVTRLGSGVIADRFGFRRTISFATAASASGFFVVLQGSELLVYVAILLFGIGLGASATLYIPILMQTFDPERETAFVGIVNLTFAVFAFFIPPVSSLAVTLTGGYAVPFVATGVLTLAGLGVFLLGTR